MSDPHAAAAAPDDEPKTPTWLPVLGAVLFLAFGLAWAIGSRTSRPTTSGSPSGAPQAAASVSAGKR